MGRPSLRLILIAFTMFWLLAACATYTPIFYHFKPGVENNAPATGEKVTVFRGGHGIYFQKVTDQYELELFLLPESYLQNIAVQISPIERVQRVTHPGLTLILVRINNKGKQTLRFDSRRLVIRNSENRIVPLNPQDYEEHYYQNGLWPLYYRWAFVQTVGVGFFPVVPEYYDLYYSGGSASPLEHSKQNTERYDQIERLQNQNTDIPSGSLYHSAVVYKLLPFDDGFTLVYEEPIPTGKKTGGQPSHHPVKSFRFPFTIESSNEGPGEIPQMRRGNSPQKMYYEPQPKITLIDETEDLDDIAAERRWNIFWLELKEDQQELYQMHERYHEHYRVLHGNERY